MLSVARNTIVSHSKGLQKQIERRVKISENTETISEKTEVLCDGYVIIGGRKTKDLFSLKIQYTPNSL